MSEIVRLKTQTQIDNEAAVWTWRLDSGGLTAAERGELEAWLRADARHRRTFDDMTATWSMLDRLVERPQDAKIASLARPKRRRGFPRGSLRRAGPSSRVTEGPKPPPPEPAWVITVLNIIQRRDRRGPV